jgi:hypothetical protein
MRHFRPTPAVVALDASEPGFVSKVANGCEASKVKELYDYPTPGAPVGRATAIEYEHGS